MHGWSNVSLTRPETCDTVSKVNLTRRGDGLNNQIRRRREALGLTQKELGARVGVSRQAINAVETGKFDPSIHLAYELAQLFGVTIEELFDLKGAWDK